LIAGSCLISDETDIDDFPIDDAGSSDDGRDDDGGDDGDDDDPDDGDEGDDESGPWTTVATFWHAAAAHIARIKLESEQIPCVLLDENLIATDWLYANAAGGIKLQVPQDQTARAVELLQGSRPAPTSAEPLFDGQARCPRCGSSEIYLTRYSRRGSFLSILLLGLPLPIFRQRTRCASCAMEWR
jgi:hypothetical protein